MSGGTTGMRQAIGKRIVAGLRQSVMLLTVALVLAAGLWILRSDRLPLRADEAFYASELAAPLIAVEDALSYYESGTHVFLDARPGADAGGIPGALPMREASLDDDIFIQQDFLFPEDPVILYGDGNLQSVSVVAAKLLERGFRSVRILRGGLSAWQLAGGPVAVPEVER